MMIITINIILLIFPTIKNYDYYKHSFIRMMIITINILLLIFLTIKNYDY